MSPTDDPLLADCRTLTEVNGGFLTWLAEHPDQVRHEQAGLSKDGRRLNGQLRRLEEAIRRPMGVGVFGPSQSGKSYLISALARKGTAPLLAAFGNQAVDFIRDLNPEGGRESTGLVTRFTVHPSPQPLPAPVQMRLLSQTDLVKIIGNTYFADCDHSDDPPLAQDALDQRLAELTQATASTAVDPLTADDVYDLQAYFERYFKGCERIRQLRHGFWEPAATLAPRLRVGERTRLFGLLWGDLEPFNRLYQTLYAGLQGLGFARDAYAGLEALLPRTRSLIDVQTLKGLGGDGGDTLTLIGAGGARIALPRSTVTALIAELRIVIQEQPWDFFAHTDLLDCPGARSREQIKDLAAFLTTADALPSLFLRGKVAYLFERYCAEQELTGMLLCIGPSNQEVKTLPDMVYDWIAATHGATPEQRSQQPTALFLVLTKFDMEFEEKAGEPSPESRWRIRLESSLLNFFGKQHDWPQRWDGKGCFRNSFWLRNPNFKAKHLFDYDEAGRETALRRGETARIERFHQAFLQDTVANRHFQDPARAWDAAFALNDGGVGYLAESLRPLCNPELKRRQITGQLTRLRQQLCERISPYYVSGNPEQVLAQRLAVAQRIAGQLIDCAGAQRFGELLAALQVDSDELEAIYYRIETRLPDTSSGEAPGIGAAVDTARMKQALGLVGGTGTAAADVAANGERKDQAALFAHEVLGEWMQDLHDLAANGALCDYYRLPDAVMGEFIQELIAGSQRLQLEARIAQTVRDATRFRLRFQQSVALPARLTAKLINQYLDLLGYEAVPLERRPTLALDGGPRPIFRPRPPVQGMLALAEQPANYDQEYYTDWIRAFLDLVEQNARLPGGVTVDLAANQLLGEWLVQLGGKP
jgi:hypothetical protein